MVAAGSLAQDRFGCHRAPPGVERRRRCWVAWAGSRDASEPHGATASTRYAEEEEEQEEEHFSTNTRILLGTERAPPRASPELAARSSEPAARCSEFGARSSELGAGPATRRAEPDAS
ncbi:unnamed protein product [Lampetra planeri]